MGNYEIEKDHIKEDLGKRLLRQDSVNYCQATSDKAKV